MLIATGIKSLPALIGFWLALFVAAVTLHEFWRGSRARHKRTGESYPLALWRLVGRNRPRYGGYVIHIGVVLMAFGIIGIELFQNETQGTLTQGEKINIGEYSLTYESLSIFDTNDGRNVARAVLSVEENGKYVGELFPRRDYFFESQQPMTIPGVKSTWEDDLYVILVDWQPITSQSATFKIYRNPLVNFMWLGGIIFILGTLIAAWPTKEIETVRTRERNEVLVGARG